MEWDDYHYYYCIKVNRDGIGLDYMHVIGTRNWRLRCVVEMWVRVGGFGFGLGFTSTFTES